MEPQPFPLRVVGAAIVEDRRLLLVSKHAAPDVFYLPGGKPDESEDELACLRRELDEELGAVPTDVTFFETIVDEAALEGIEMRMSVYLAALDRPPRPCAEIAGLEWFETADAFTGTVAPAVRNQVIPRLREAGLL
ncbi:MAG TPA: NUDIX domain-containing protein [Gaiellaceae bacterium]|jgi:8-oxo-dGTP pyrophosphatase MutT (NUDIX family)|nr:NUDIX domain-containing protein [Gaiellaceae bacterium]